LLWQQREIADEYADCEKRGQERDLEQARVA